MTKLIKDLFLMKNLFTLFILLIMFSCQTEVEFTAGTENKLTGFVDFGSFTADFKSDGARDSNGNCCSVEQWMIDSGDEYSADQLGLCIDNEGVEIKSIDPDATGNERYRIEITATDFFAQPNFCDNYNWEGIMHQLKINFITNELKDQYQISSGTFATENPSNIENPFITVQYYVYRFSQSEGYVGRYYEGNIANLDIVDFNTSEDYASGSFYGTAYRENGMGGVDSVMLKNIVFNKINIVD
mgnify:FL=1